MIRSSIYKVASFMKIKLKAKNNIFFFKVIINVQNILYFI